MSIFSSCIKFILSNITTKNNLNHIIFLKQPNSKSLNWTLVCYNYDFIWCLTFKKLSNCTFYNKIHLLLAVTCFYLDFFIKILIKGVSWIILFNFNIYWSYELHKYDFCKFIIVFAYFGMLHLVKCKLEDANLFELFLFTSTFLDISVSLAY